MIGSSRPGLATVLYSPYGAMLLPCGSGAEPTPARMSDLYGKLHALLRQLDSPPQSATNSPISAES
jgi:hypothetical protein